MQRIFVVGNSGSGKTWLANRLAEELCLPAVHLDDLHWLPEFAGERSREERIRLVAEAANDSGWVMEGIYGRILQQVLPRVTTLTWLDLSVDECISNLQNRGQTGGGTDEQFQELLEYARGYPNRQNHLNSFEGHRRLFDSHTREKIKIVSRPDAASFLATVTTGRQQIS
ncbi:hypothetical protein [Rhizobium sp. RU36D]|uniref:hypothetical protein n=1 Tax=Rhizobium sp. RU36D TaxID=1907415 RepID=UPI000A01A983|nr:hypothetical protein [Rhizobium sp. RU36D]